MCAIVVRETFYFGVVVAVDLLAASFILSINVSVFVLFETSAENAAIKILTGWRIKIACARHRHKHPIEHTRQAITSNSMTSMWWGNRQTNHNDNGGDNALEYRSMTKIREMTSVRERERARERILIAMEMTVLSIHCDCEFKFNDSMSTHSFKSLVWMNWCCCLVLPWREWHNQKYFHTNTLHIFAWAKISHALAPFTFEEKSRRDGLIFSWLFSPNWHHSLIAYSSICIQIAFIIRNSEPWLTLWKFNKIHYTSFALHHFCYFAATVQLNDDKYSSWNCNTYSKEETREFFLKVINVAWRNHVIAMKNEQKITFPEMIEKCVALAVSYHTQRCSAEWKKMRVKGREKNVTRKLPSTEKYQIL